MIAAGIVTYNPDMERLRENLAAIAPQVDAVLIFDNGSANSAAISRALSTIGESESIGSHIELRKRNYGLAVALNALAALASELGCTDVLMLDQDSVAERGLVEMLAAARSEDVAIVCPHVVDRNEMASQMRQRGIFDVPRAITSGSLVNLASWSAVGGYDERLFVDWVDFEFSDNLRTHGYRIVRNGDASILHELGKEEYAGKIPRRAQKGGIEMRTYYRTNHAEWRLRDKARSQAITISKYQGTAVGREELSIFLKGSLKTLLLERSRLCSLRAIFLGWHDGRCLVKDEGD